MGIIVRNMNMSDFSNVRLSPKGFGKGIGVGGGAGNTTLLSSAIGWDGTTQVIYYGEVPASEFFTGAELSTLLGVTQGTLQNSTTDWFKFGLGDKTLFIPKQTFRHSISWDHIYSRGLVYGTDDNGLAPTGTPTNQLRVVSKDGFNYKVRLIRGSSIDPHNGTSGTNLAISQGSEWNELMYRVSSANPNGTGENFAMYTDAQLNITSGNGTYIWCQEQYSVGSTSRVFRGSNSVGYLSNNTSSFTGSSRGWRPALELIP
jgi:hypothetical protein